MEQTQNGGDSMLRRVWIGIFLGLCCSFFSLHAAKVGLLVVATGKYTEFVGPLVDSARRYFCPGHEVTYFIFTDGEIEPAQDVVKLFHPRLGWPFDTMMRYGAYHRHRGQLMGQDYLFACDADMLFCDTVGDEILSERVATLHPGYIGVRGNYETNPNSSACVFAQEGQFYFAGGFYGGTTAEVLCAVQTNLDHITKDLEQGIIALWHDESHWNRYCIDHPPTRILSPSYCYPESAGEHYFRIWGGKVYAPKLLALDKNHGEIRTTSP